MDSNKKIVGTYNFNPLFGFGAHQNVSAIRQINGFWFQLPVGKGGFYGTIANSSIQYTGLNCTGTAYIADLGTDQGGVLADELVLDAVTGTGLAAIDTRGAYPQGTVNALLYYGTGQEIQTTVCSEAIRSENPGATGNCLNFPQCSVSDLFPMSTFDLSTLGFVPPFHLQRAR